jgi:NADH-quinone oxidoreductase subunit L
MEKPGLLFVAATLLPLASFVLVILAGAVRAAARPYQQTPLGSSLFRALGGDAPQKTAAYVATASIGLAFILSLAGFILYMQGPGAHVPHVEGAAEAPPAEAWKGQVPWATLSYGGAPGTVLTLGYYIDSLAAIMFMMVTFIATLIHLFSIGYMNEELAPLVEDHHVHTPEGHLERKGRFGRFFMFLSLFCFSMLNLILADNLFQVFVSWELVGACSYLLIGFYFERRSACNAANKAFITNRVGDAGFIIGLLILWSYVGTLNFVQLFEELPVRLADGSLPHWLLVIAGLGVFLGCVGKSAQFPLHVWLPDAMEGPTPVSALIHAATMVAAGVYLVGRVYPIFTLEARLVIAYTGGITLFLAGTIAIVMTDIKKVLAYSTVSQLGYMMLALGVGGWVAGLFHLLTHAFFKALLFLGSGSVIYGCHHEQEMTKMGGLYSKMKITSLTMLAGVLAIAGMPLFSGWYSKDMILAQALGFVMIHREHALLFILPLMTAGITAFYMFRMWFMTFMGPPKDGHVHLQAHESPRIMTTPLIILAVLSIVVAWGFPPYSAELSYVGGHEGLLQMSEPRETLAHLHLIGEEEKKMAEEWHSMAEILAYFAGGLGFAFASMFYWVRLLDPAEASAQFPAVHRFLLNKWYVDELYSALLVRPALAVAHWCRAFDTKVIDGTVDGIARETVRLAKADGRFDADVIDGTANGIADVFINLGRSFRHVQTGYLRSYVLFLVLGALAAFFVLSFYISWATAG